VGALNVLDLTSGIGGFSLGLEAVQDHRVQRDRGMGETGIGEALARSAEPGGHHEAWHRADVVTLGFPCQDISDAGKGAGIAGERSDLWRWGCGAIRLVRPAYAIVENVAALLRRGMGTVLGDLAEVGYDAEWHCIPASHVGAPHDRDRVWIIANPERGERWTEPYGRSLGRVGRTQQSVPWDATWQGALRILRGVDDGSAYGAHRVDTIRNAVVPQVVEEIGRAILDAERNFD
jgi:DNA (cytosine-5)-methyltransferase 1